MSVVRVTEMLEQRLGSWAQMFAQLPVPWIPLYGLGRTFIGLGTLLTLLFNSPELLFREMSGVPNQITCSNFASVSLYCVVGEEQLEVARWLSIFVLLTVVSGWRPRFTGVLHWYVSFSFFAAARVSDGGDQTAAVLSLLLIPLTLMDPRPWHWFTYHTLGTFSSSPRQVASKIFAWSALLIIKFQVALIYFHAGIAKMQVPEWANGTALYYWLNSPYMGLVEPLKTWSEPVLMGSIVAALTWSVMAFEVSLFASLFMSRRARLFLLWIAAIFHFSIAVLMGISSFSVTMFGAAILLLVWPQERINLPFKYLFIRGNHYHQNVDLQPLPESVLHR